MQKATEPRHREHHLAASVLPSGKAPEWRSRAGTWPPSLDLPLDRPRGSVWSAKVARNRYSVAPDTWTAVRRAARRLGLSTPAVLLSCYALLLHRLARQNSLAIGYLSPAQRGQGPREESTIIPIVSESGASLTLNQLLSATGQALSDGEARAIPYETIRALTSHIADASRAGPVEAQFSFTKTDAAGRPPSGIESTPAIPFDLAFNFLQEAEALSLEISYNANILDSSTVDRWAGHFDCIASHLNLPGETLIGRVPLMNDAECRRIVTAWNQSTAIYPHDKSVAQVFEDTAAVSPGAVALSCGETRLTYGELNARANQLAYGLTERGVRRGALVAISFERSIESIVAILGVLKAGAAYIPIDAAYPDSRVQYMLKDAAVELILTSSTYLSRFIPFGFPLLPLDTEWPTLALMPERRPPAESSADDLAYAIYTSGSTGQPKGVLVPQRGIVRLVRNTNYAAFEPGEVFLQLAPLVFDASVFEIFGALLNGLHLVIAPEKSDDPEVLAEVIREHGVTTLWLTAALFHLIAAEHLDLLRPLRQLLAGGDALSLAHVRRVLDELPHLRLINGYGSTENTVFSTCHPVTRESLLPTSVPLGRPISNSRVYILDSLLQPVPAGVPGELCLAGDGLAFGYLNQPELTQERFLTVELPGAGAQRLYRTGDMGCYRPDGVIEFLGRIDDQVKIRGYRVELGEIEAALERLPLISSAAATVYEDPAVPGDRRLAAYIVPAAGAPPKTQLIAEIHSQLRAELPAYMHPAAIISLDELPRTINGKVDRRRLPAAHEESSANYIAPRDATERQLAQIWEEALGRKNAGIDDSFFTTGWYSLTIVRLFTRINKAFKTSLPITTIFNAPTIAQLAEVLRGRAIYSALVPVQTRGTKPPLFLLHSYLLYGKLPEAIGWDQPIYGLRELEDDGDISIRERAARYVVEIRNLQPHGPYYVAGWSAAGSITVEVSGQLTKAGEEVALTLIFDAVRPGYEEEVAAAKKAARTSLREHPVIEKLRFHAERLSKLSSKGKLAYLEESLLRRIENARQDFLLRHWNILERLSQRFGIKLPDFLHNVSYRTFAALQTHRGDIIPNRITLLRAADSGEMPGGTEDWGWSCLTTAGVDVFFAPGTHETMFREPCLPVTAAIVREAIARGAGARTALNGQVEQTKQTGQGQSTGIRTIIAPRGAPPPDVILGAGRKAG